MKLESSITSLKYISDRYEGKLNSLGIYTIKDLLTYFPRKYTDSSEVHKISDIAFEDVYTIQAKVINIKNVRLNGRRTLQTGKVEDFSGKLNIQFFNQPYLTKALKNGETYLFRGKSKIKGKNIVFYPSSYDEVKEEEESINLGRISPEYSLTEGISKKWLRKRIKELLDITKEKEFKIPVEEEILTEDSLKTFLNEIHFPKNEKSLKTAKDALSILEMTNIHLKVKQQLEKKLKKISSYFPNDVKDNLKEIFTYIPFKITKDQKKAVELIINNLHDKRKLDVLLQGDVGSGKTIIAFILAYLFAKEGKQVVMLAPTTVLAKQHYDNAVKLFSCNKDMKIELVSSEIKERNKGAFLIGTTALLHRKKDVLDKIELLIVDEQHRFGVVQREELLGKKNNYTHFINMTATPIPRTIAEVFFKDIDVFTIKSKPKGRKEVKTFLVPDEKREDIYDWLNNKIINDQDQVYWICPLITESEDSNNISVEEVYKKVKKKLPKVRVQMLHGKMKATEKQKIMKQYSDGEFDILVSTTVIEIGVDVANATVMVIENAEMFGLAQLHQIRGRVGRGDKQSYCFLFTDPEINPEAKERLEFFTKTKDGLKIAEYDLFRRGPGEVYGTKQSGIPNLKIANILDLDLIKKTKSIAEKVYNLGIREISLFS